MKESPGGHVLVTGACGGIGVSVTTMLMERGVEVSALDVAPNVTCGVDSITCDVSDAEQVASSVAEAVAKRGPLTGVVHSAGVLHSGLVEEVTPEQFERLLAVNTFGVYAVLRATAPRLAESGGGSVVVVTSNAARVPRQALGLYGASKAGAEMVAKSVGLTYARAGVRVNCVAPGSTRTDMLRQAMGSDDIDVAAVQGAPEQFRLGIPLGRISEPDDVAKTVMFLLSDASRGMTLETLTVDGGAGLGA